MRKNLSSLLTTLTDHIYHSYKSYNHMTEEKNIEGSRIDNVI